MTKEKEIGNLLKKTRTEKLLDISNVSDILKIRKKYLFSLEEGNFGEIPGKAYAEGYIKLYSDYLGITKEIEDITNSPKVKRRETIKVKKHMNDTWVVASIYSVVILLTLYFIVSTNSPDSDNENIIKYLIDDSFI